MRNKKGIDALVRNNGVLKVAFVSSKASLPNDAITRTLNEYFFK